MLYDIGFLIFSVFYLPTLIFKGKLHGGLAERFGCYSAEKRKSLSDAKGAIWIQAVSVGEVALCRDLIPLIKREFPANPIVFSTITRTGWELANKLYSRDAVIIYFPLDISFVVKKTIALIRPSLYVMIETEIWPNVLKELSLRAVPSALINGRISDRSFGKYLMARPFLKRTLERIGVFCMQSKEDAERIKILGAPPEKVIVTGNMKFDFQVQTHEESLSRIKEFLGFSEGMRLFVAGSTHSGEENIAISVYKSLLAEFPDLKLLIAPRHIERASEVERVVKKAGFTPFFLSSSLFARLAEPRSRRVVYILDAIGYLNDAYSIASVVFIGGSLVPHGGQNPIEPAVFGKAVIFGPYMFNFKNISAALLEGGGAIQVKDSSQLYCRVKSLLKEESVAFSIGSAAQNIIKNNRGATVRNLAVLKELL
ncbi:MAG: 3-deoxy-D-manno-octulosonic acid transferase [Candidatus Omnitrophica bacterium]|nr:3-deoxy-D-manno-octulosonic acid transferase [Candidatus Omnitrophota bacterium]